MQQLNEIIVWNNIKITVLLNMSNFTTYVDHLELITENKQPLPVTETGYRSHFFKIKNCIPKNTTVLEWIYQWLDHEAKSNKKWQRYWKEHQKALQQPDLFGDLQ